MPAVTPVFVRAIVPLETTGFAPPPVTQIPFDTPREDIAVQLDALTTWPWLLMVRVGKEYVPATTPVGEMAIVPFVVIKPPYKPAPAVMLQMVPGTGLEEIVVMRP